MDVILYGSPKQKLSKVVTEPQLGQEDQIYKIYLLMLEGIQLSVEIITGVQGKPLGGFVWIVK